MNLEFIDIPAEQTTAATDAVFAIIAFACSLSVLLTGREHQWRARLWAAVLALLSMAALLGAAAHGIKMPAEINLLIWQPISLGLGVTIALFSVGVVYDLWGQPAARGSLPWLTTVAVGFFVVTQFLQSFAVFVVYQSIAMLFAICAYYWLAVSRRAVWAGFMAAGILITIIAGAIQAQGSLSIKLIWEFDHNGIYHLVQMPGVVLLAAGVCKANGAIARTGAPAN